MGRQHIDHGDIVAFAQERVNLPKDKADEYRAQARRLRERLESYLSEHPDFTLKKMLLSGSLAKGTRCPSRASAAAMQAQVVDLPTPPLEDANVMIMKPQTGAHLRKYGFGEMCTRINKGYRIRSVRQAFI